MPSNRGVAVCSRSASSRRCDAFHLGVGGGTESFQSLPFEDVSGVAHVALDLAGQQLDLDDLGRAGDAFGFGQRDGVDGMAGRSMDLHGDVAHQLISHGREVGGPVSRTMVDGVAVDHRADRVAVA
jgi:hypothetical protein